MADWSSPSVSDLKVDILTLLKARDVDAITLSESITNPPTGAIRWVTASNKFQRWNGSAWVDLVLAVASGGTGGSSQSAARTALGLGTLSTQNSNAISVSGGSITGLSSLSTSGSLNVGGLLIAGSAPTILTNSAGQVYEASIENGGLIPRKAANEVITGTWTIGNGLADGVLNFNGGLANVKGIYFYQSGYAGRLVSVNGFTYFDGTSLKIRDIATNELITVDGNGLTASPGKQILADAGSASVPGFAFASGAYQTGLYNDGTHSMRFTVGGVDGPRIRNISGAASIDMASTRIENDLLPFFTNSYDLGSTTYKWQDIWATNGTILTSDINHKRNHGPITNPLDMLRRTETLIASWLSGPDHLRFPALSAQNIKEVWDGELGTEIVKVDKFGVHSMYYERMIPGIIAILKELDAQVQGLRKV